MKSLFDNNRKLIALMGILFSAIILVSAAVAVLLQSSDHPLFAEGAPSSAPAQGPAEEPADPESDPAPEPDFADLPTLDETQPEAFNRPDEMRAVMIAPGREYLAGEDKSQATAQRQIDAAIQSAVEMTMNTVILEVASPEGVAYPSGWFPQLAAGFDPLEYAIGQARQQGLYVYCVYPLLAQPGEEGITAPPAIAAATLDSMKLELAAFAKAYPVDGILFDNFQNPNTEESYALYLQNGGGIGYEAYMRTAARTAVEQAMRVLRAYAPNVQVGLLTDPVWANQAQQEGGSTTNASYTMLADGNADVAAWLREGLADCVAVRNYGALEDGAAPFGAVAGWWGALAVETGKPIYMVHAADRICTDQKGWSAPDQITKQIIEARKVTGYSGSAFNSLAHLQANPKEATDLLLKFFRDEVSSDYILAELEMTSPPKLTYETFETVATFQGATLPGIEVTLNGKAVQQNQSGYFSVSQELQPGLNTFTIQSKDKVYTYNITRRVKVLQDVSPTGKMTVDGGMQITVTAEAYRDAKVTATLAGQTIALEEWQAEDDQTNKDSSYVRYTGSFTAPEATTAVQQLGTVQVTASYQGVTEKGTGASISVNKKVQLGDGQPVRVTATQAETFPADTLSDYSDGNCYPLPKGALDYAVGDEIIFSQGNTTYRYYLLESGQRVYASNITSTGTEAGGNVIKGLAVKNDGRYTDVVLSMSQNVSYTARYTSSGMSFQFHYTDEVCGGLRSLSKNPLFESATWSGTTLNLKFRKAGAMLGYRASYNEGGNTLTLRFNNPPSGLSDARIVIDPGHGGSDPGALGNISGKHESFINAQVAAKLEKSLRNAGASVYRIDTSGSGKVELNDRINKAYAYDPHLFISLHCNSALNTSAKGHEVYYFYPFSKGLASSVNNGLGNAIGTDRGVKYGLYRVTRTSHYGSVLAEMGFVSNYDEYSRLLSSTVQQSIASGITSAVNSYLRGLSSGSYPTGTEKAGDVDENLPVSSESETSDSALPPETTSSIGSSSTGSSTSGAVSGTEEDVKTIRFEEYRLTMQKGDKAQLHYTLTPNLTLTPKLTWTSSNPEVATVAADGTVTAVKGGTASIRVALTARPDVYDLCDITVTDSNIKVSGILLRPTELSAKVGGARMLLRATVTPSTAANRAVVWSSSDPEVASISGSSLSVYVVPGKKAGTATITATAADGSGVVATCTVTVVGEASSESTPSSSSTASSDSNTTESSSSAISSDSSTTSSGSSTGSSQIPSTPEESTPEGGSAASPSSSTNDAASVPTSTP